MPQNHSAQAVYIEGSTFNKLKRFYVAWFLVYYKIYYAKARFVKYFDIFMYLFKYQYFNNALEIILYFQVYYIKTICIILKPII